MPESVSCTFCVASSIWLMLVDICCVDEACSSATAAISCIASLVLAMCLKVASSPSNAFSPSATVLIMNACVSSVMRKEF